MSHSHSTASSSNNFQLIINNALKAYEKRTKRDLLAHPLATQLQDCNSPADILAILHQQVQGINQSSNTEDRWTKWLDPTINILYTLSETLGAGVSLVSQIIFELVIQCILIYIWQVFSPGTVIFAGVGVLLSVRILLNVYRAVNMTPASHRRLRMFEKAKIRSSIFLSALKGFSDDSGSTQQCSRPRK